MTDSPRPQYGEYAPTANPTIAHQAAVQSIDVHPPTGQYVAAGGGSLPYGTQVPEGPKPRTLGLVAAIGAIVLFMLSAATSVIAGVMAGSVADPYATFEQDMAAPMTADHVLLGSIVMLHLIFGTAVGIWTLVQGIFAVVTRRGRGFGIAAIVLAVSAPVVSLLVYFVVSGATLATRM